MALPEGQECADGNYWLRRNGTDVYMRSGDSPWQLWSTAETRMRSQFKRQKKRLRAALITRDGAVCSDCPASLDLTIDHIRPLSRGGTNDPTNLRLLCRSCNSRKGDRA